jgi:MMP 1-O-methyltransferase
MTEISEEQHTTEMTEQDIAEAELPFGWLSETEAAGLAKLAEGKTVLEFGSFLGRSTIVLARAAALVVAVDHHRGSPEHQILGASYQDGSMDAHGRIDTSRRFLDNLARAGVRDKVIPFVGDIEAAARFLQRASFDLVFVDAEHSREATMRGGEIAFQLAKSDGIVAFHDFQARDFPGVTQAVIDIAARYQATTVSRAGSMIALQRVST